MARDVVFAPEALDDLLQLQDTIAEVSTPERAFAYVQRLRAHCLGFATFPERGTRRDDVRSFCGRRPRRLRRDRAVRGRLSLRLN